MMELLTTPTRRTCLIFSAMRNIIAACFGRALPTGRVLLILSKVIPPSPAYKQDLIDLIPKPTVVAGLTDGYLALMVQLEDYAKLVAEFIKTRTGG